MVALEGLITHNHPLPHQLSEHHGSLEILSTGKRLSSYQLDRILSRHKQDSGVKLLVNPFIGPYNASAASINQGRFLVHDYLEGFAPFKADNVYVPLQVLAKRKTYQYDHQQYMGRKDVWQGASKPTSYCGAIVKTMPSFSLTG